MEKKTGFADLPLHSGHVPKWISDRMTKPGAVTQAIMLEYEHRNSCAASRIPSGSSAWLRNRLDWNSSGNMSASSVR
jgi:hypothetical protein